MADMGSKECPFCNEDFSEDELEDHLHSEHSERVCSQCGKPLDTVMPHECNHCGKKFCPDHRLPENHDCSGLGGKKERLKRDESVSYMDSKEESKKEGGENNSDEGLDKTSSSIDFSLPSIGKPFRKSRRIFKRKTPSVEKMMPLIGIGLLAWIFHAQSSDKGMIKSITSISWDTQFSTVLSKATQSIVQTEPTQLGITALIVATLWTGYKYWLREVRYIRKNSSLLEKLVIVLIFVVIVDRHILLDTVIGKYADYAIFAALLYLEVAATWFAAKTIDGIDLSSDLYLWSLRILGGVVVFFGAIVFMSGSMTVSLSGSDAVSQNIFWIAGICLILLGMFMNYRSVRRHPAIHIW